MMSLIRLRRKEPRLERPFAAPLYPVLPMLAMVIAIFALLAMAWYNQIVFAVFVVMMVLGYGYFLATKHHRSAAPEDDMLVQTSEEAGING